MLNFLLKRFIQGVVTLFLVVTLVFFLIRLMPGGAFDKERKIPEAILKNLLAKYKLDGTAGQVYFDYMKDLFRGDLRDSLKYRARSVGEIIGQTLPVSMTLGLFSFALALSGGVTLGAAAAVRHRTWLDQLSMFLAVLSISIPTFVIAPLAILLFALYWPLFPVAGWGEVQHLILPGVCLALPFVAYIARLTRNSVLEVINQDFIRTARAKGLDETRLIMKHVIKVAILPVVSYSGPLAANILTGSLVVEEIFKIPGLGPFFVNSVFNRDTFMILGIVLLYSSLLILFNAVVDIVYTWLDKRIKLA
jgi:oligopeptide transport system permease protein